jgi:hypothetical protein
MSTIKIQQYDRQIAPLGRGMTPQMNNIDVSSGMEAIGQGIASIGDAIERKNLDDDAVAINKIQSNAEVQWTDWMNQSQDKWQRGDKELPAQLFENFDKWQKETSPGFKTKQGKSIFEQRMHEFRNNLGKSALNWQASTNEKLKLGDLELSRENMQKVAAANPALAEGIATRFVQDTNNMILSPEQRQRQQMAAQNEVALAAEIGLIEKGLNDWKPDKRWSWDNLTFEQQQRLKDLAEQKRREAEANQRNAKNAQEQIDRDTAKDVIDAKVRGIKISPQAEMQAQQILKNYADKPWSAALSGVNQYATEARTMAQWPIQEQRKAAALALADAEKAGADKVGLGVDRAAFLAKSAAENEKRVREDAYLYYEQTYGQEIEPLDPSQDLMSQLGARKEKAYIVQAATGVNPGLLRPQEAPQFADMLQRANPDQALAIINRMAEGDKDTARATFDKLGEAGPIYAVTGKMQMTGAKLPDGRQVGGVMLSGYKALEQKALKFKSQKDLDRAVSDEVGDLFANAPDEYQTAKDAVSWLLAGKALAAGQYDYEPTTTDVEKAIKEVINPIKYEGRKVSAPIGTDADNFDDVIKPKITQAIGLAALSDENKKLLSRRHQLLDADGDGVYDLAWSSGIRVLDANGNPVKVYYK